MGLVSMRIVIEGSKVQEIGYRIFLLRQAMLYGVERIYANNLGKDKVEVLLSDKKDKVKNFYEVIRRERPPDAKVKDVKEEPYQGGNSIPPIDRYFQFLNLEQLSKGREEILQIPNYIGPAVKAVGGTFNRIDTKFNNVIDRFGVFGKSMKSVDGKLTGMDKKLGGMDESLKGIGTTLDKISTLPEKIDALPEKIAEALNPRKKQKP